MRWSCLAVVNLGNSCRTSHQLGVSIRSTPSGRWTKVNRGLAGLPTVDPKKYQWLKEWSIEHWHSMIFNARDSCVFYGVCLPHNLNQFECQWHCFSVYLTLWPHVCSYYDTSRIVWRCCRDVQYWVMIPCHDALTMQILQGKIRDTDNHTLESLEHVELHSKGMQLPFFHGLTL